MSIQVAAGVLLIVSPIWFNVWFAVLAKRFDYPDILRKPTDEILTRFREGGSSLILCWWAFMCSGFLLIAAVVLVSLLLSPRSTTLAVAAGIVGVLAGLVQVLGLLRWVYLVPALARMNADPDVSEATRAATDVTFRAFHQYLGVGVGEHLGYGFTGAWTALVGVAIIAVTGAPAWLGWSAVVLGAGLVLGALEFLGPNEESGWALAGKAIPILYILWSLWMLVLGVILLV